MRGLLCAAALLGVAAAPAPASKIDYTDLTGEFARYWEQSQDLADIDRSQGFRAHFAKILPGFYDAARNSVEPAKYDRFVANGLRAFPKDRAGIEDVSKRFSALLDPAVASFETRVGPVGDQRVVLLHSLGEMDGGVRTLGGKRTLVFGADQIAKFHANHRIEPFFHHELFHQFHARFFAGCDQLWCSLWSEGLAVYAASRLTKDATDAELLLTVPKPIRPEVDAKRQVAVCSLTAKLNSTSSVDFGVLFSFDRPRPDLPARYGYYVGYLAAAELGRERSLNELARLTTEEAQPLFAAALKRLSECPPSK